MLLNVRCVEVCRNLSIFEREYSVIFTESYENAVREMGLCTPRYSDRLFVQQLFILTSKSVTKLHIIGPL